MLRRADRALLMAKANGRNTVVQLGSGSTGEAEETKRGFWIFTRARPATLLEQTLITPVPIKMAIEKLRGFVADHEARIVKIDGNHVELEIDDRHPGRLRRLTDRPMTFRLDLRFEEQRQQKDIEEGAVAAGVRTKVVIVVSPVRNRDRRRNDVALRARQVLASFRSYLMAVPEDEEPPSPPGAFDRARRILTPWRAKKE